MGGTFDWRCVGGEEGVPCVYLGGVGVDDSRQGIACAKAERRVHSCCVEMSKKAKGRR